MEIVGVIKQGDELSKFKADLRKKEALKITPKNKWWVLNSSLVSLFESRMLRFPCPNYVVSANFVAGSVSFFYKSMACNWRKAF